MKVVVSALCLGALLVASTAPVRAQVFDTGPSDSSLFTRVLHIPPDPDVEFNQSIGGVVGETIQVNLRDQGTISRYLEVLSGVEINIEGGSVGANLQAMSGSEVNIDGGSVGFGFEAHSGSLVNITGGSVGSSLVAHDGSVVNASGGSVVVSARDGSLVTLSGGLTSFSASGGSEVVVRGGELEFDGEPVVDFATPGGSEGFFTGAYADGTPFVLHSSSISPLAEASLVETPLPTPDSTPFTIDEPVTSAPFGMRGGQVATLVEGGSLRNGYHVLDSTLHIKGGEYSVVAIQSTINVEAGDGSVSAGPSSVVNVRGNGVVNVGAWGGGVINATGGQYLGIPSTSSGGVLNVSGGEWRPLFYLIRSGSSFNVFGKDFFLDGERLESLKLGEPFVIAERSSYLTGTLADGSDFSVHLFEGGTNLFNLFSRDATVTVTLVVPEPASAMLLLAVTCGVIRQR